MTATVTPLVPPGETLLGAAFGNQSGGCSSKFSCQAAPSNTGEAQLQGLGAVVDFLRRAKRS